MATTSGIGECGLPSPSRGSRAQHEEQEHDRGVHEEQQRRLIDADPPYACQRHRGDLARLRAGSRDGAHRRASTGDPGHLVANATVDGHQRQYQHDNRSERCQSVDQRSAHGNPRGLDDRKLCSAQADELRLINLEMRAGTARADALHSPAARTGVDDVASLVAMLVQADKFGTSVAQSLRIHSETLRTKCRQRAEEAAAKTGVKMVFRSSCASFRPSGS